MKKSITNQSCGSSHPLPRTRHGWAPGWCPLSDAETASVSLVSDENAIYEAPGLIYLAYGKEEAKLGHGVLLWLRLIEWRPSVRGAVNLAVRDLR